jgi:hypothetical protein
MLQGAKGFLNRLRIGLTLVQLTDLVWGTKPARQQQCKRQTVLADYSWNYESFDGLQSDFERQLATVFHPKFRLLQLTETKFKSVVDGKEGNGGR